MDALSAPEDAGWILFELGQEFLDGHGRWDTLVPMEGQVPVPPVQRPPSSHLPRPLTTDRTPHTATEPVDTTTNDTHHPPPPPTQDRHCR